MLAIAANLGLSLRQLDFTCACLHADLHEALWVRPPPGISVPPGHAWRLHKALYGLRQAGRELHQTLDSTIREFGFRRCSADPCLCTRVNPDNPKLIVILLIYVDDVILAANWASAADELVNNLLVKFNVKDLGALSWFLGMHIVRDGSSILISQAQHIETILKRFNFWECKPYAPPCASTKRLTNLPAEHAPDPAETAEVAKFPHREVIGSLLPAACVSLPDIAATVCFLARRMADQRLVHVQAAKRCLRHLRGTHTLGLRYSPSSDPLFAHVDSNWAGDDARHSTSGYAFWLAGSLISWASKKQRSVALSSCEAEHHAASLAAAEAKWLRTLLAELQQQREDRRKEREEEETRRTEEKAEREGTKVNAGARKSVFGLGGLRDLKKDAQPKAGPRRQSQLVAGVRRTVRAADGTRRAAREGRPTAAVPGRSATSPWRRSARPRRASSSCAATGTRASSSSTRPSRATRSSTRRARSSSCPARTTRSRCATGRARPARARCTCTSSTATRTSP